MAKTLIFGIGAVYANEVPVGIVQNVSVDIAASVKQLFGENIFPEAIGVGTHSVTGSIASAKINTAFMPKFMFGTDMEAGSLQRIEEPAVVPTTPFQVTVAQSADFAQNVAVINAGTGDHFKLVASGPTAGQYAVAAGVYTFAAADVGAALIIRYDVSVAGGQSFEMKNRRMGQQYPFKLVLANEFQGAAYMMTLNACVLTKMGLAAKNDDFGVPMYEFSSFVNDAGILGRFDFASTT